METVKKYSIENTKIGTVYITEITRKLRIGYEVNYIIQDENGKQLTDSDLWAYEDPFINKPFLISCIDDYWKAIKIFSDINGEAQSRRLKFCGVFTRSRDDSPLEYFGWAILTEKSKWRR